MTDEKEEEEYVKFEADGKSASFETNVAGWWNMDQVIYVVLYEALKAFLGKLRDGSALDRTRCMNKEFADANGFVYHINMSDYESKEVPHPAAGEVVYGLLGFDENHDLILDEPTQIPADATVHTVPMELGTVDIEIDLTIEKLIKEYDEADYHGKRDWWVKAQAIVPFLWD